MQMKPSGGGLFDKLKMLPQLAELAAAFRRRLLRKMRRARK